ncbi:MAG: Ribulose-phosphate 3-epimerase [Candidatus Yanofskybacteria bacterium GW2011_GWA1_44_21]|nr:MAG: Ribulose-phosphate 3-epimerase [Candidatus Yanofskybacteria bacterium GW2011_GWA2_44_10]KKT50579.1 MAG: Ribulose-phosphate 3-epimerase [Candidatus Yanofskybacteria bacterium GW2011_GWA1_44_21]OGN02761.1 MAG: hypothetical protein A2657_01290 [Candidatus Yanofskybacteria bacterium RIFCSPHIGHO2_01_FULL_44_110b]OGN35075.1 MAG: hypothetical protein A3G02_02005 [Candidatus Yanofskybacteria bacterium RIFCSPLOWO2_12_FULL_44_13b]
MEIIPSILTDDPADFREKIKKLELLVMRIAIDVADGTLTSSATVSGYAELNSIQTDLNIDAHLMVRNPAAILVEWLKTKAGRFFIHSESDADSGRLIDDIHSAGKKIGLVLNPETPIEKIEVFLNRIDLVQFMAVNPGFDGGHFVESVVEKIRNFHDNYPDMPIVVDGSVNPDTIPKLIAAGASEFVVGSYIWQSQDIGQAIKKLQNV